MHVEVKTAQVSAPYSTAESCMISQTMEGGIFEDEIDTDAELVLQINASSLSTLGHFHQPTGDMHMPPSNICELTIYLTFQGVGTTTRPS